MRDLRRGLPRPQQNTARMPLGRRKWLEQLKAAAQIRYVMPEKIDATIDGDPHLLRGLLRQHAKRLSERGVGDPSPSHHYHVRHHSRAFEKKRANGEENDGGVGKSEGIACNEVPKYVR